MGRIYLGTGGNTTHVGSCENGYIYSLNDTIGYYESGKIYNKNKAYVGSYGGNSIYDSKGSRVGSYDDGSEYNQHLYVMYGKERVGSYTDNPAEAAALVLLFLGGNAVNGDDEDRDIPNPEPTPTPSPRGSSDTGCLSTLFSMVFVVIGAILKLLWPVIKFLAVWFYLPMYVAPTLVGFIAMLFFAIIGLPMVSMGIAFALTALEFISIPYWVVLFIQKRKKCMTWKETFKYYGKWFIKGPWAYKDIIELKNKPMGD